MEKPSRIWSCRTIRQRSSEKLADGFVPGLKRSKRSEQCSRWPIKEQCGQECLMDLDVAPERCLVSGVLMRWYRGRNCCYCGKPFEELHWIDHKPALKSPEGFLKRWSAVLVGNLSMVLETHLPVCWDCFIAQSFLREHPDVVVYRPWRYDIPGGVDGSSASRQL